MAFFGGYLYVVVGSSGGCEVWRLPPVPIPALTEVGLLVLMTILVGTGVVILRKRRMV
jgi:hypothetical protein